LYALGFSWIRVDAHEALTRMGGDAEASTNPRLFLREGENPYYPDLQTSGSPYWMRKDITLPVSGLISKKVSVRLRNNGF